MRNHQVKIKLTKTSSALAADDYRIAQISGAITVDADKRPNLTVGDFISTNEAEQLNRHYQVTVLLK
jgi:hypothetical protein